MQTRLTNILLIAIFLVLLGGLVFAAYYLKTPTSSYTATPTPSTSASATATPNPTESWVTAKSATGSFSVKYPPEMTQAGTLASFPLTQKNARGLTFSFSNSYSINTNLNGATITAVAEDGAAACTATLPNGDTPQTVKLGAYTWTLVNAGEGAAGHAYKYRVYSYVNGTTCYRMYLSTDASNVTPKSELPAFDATHFNAVLEEMIGTFTLN
jgi:hypothetical protein